MEALITAPATKQEFWSHFVDRYWEQSPLVMPNPPVGLGLDAEELFDILVDAIELSGRSQDSPLARFYLDGFGVAADLHKYVPTRTDRSFASYFRRMEEDFGGRDYNLNLSRLHTASFSLWERARAFLGGLYEELQQLPPGLADVDVFIGRYRSSPVGIHTDRAGNFMFTIWGKKRMLVWPPGAKDDIPLLTMSYEDARESATWLEGDPSTLVYFPSDYPHVGESPVAPSVSLNVALYFDGTPVADVTSELEKGIRKTSQGVPRPPMYRFPLPAEADRLPSEFEPAIAAISQAADPHVLHEAAIGAWLRRVSSGGFGSMPPPLSVEPVGDEGVIQLRDWEILSHFADESVLVAANGFSAKLPNVHGLRNVLKTLNSGKPVEMRDLYSHAGPSQAPSFREVVQALVYRLRSWGAVELLSD